MFCLGFSERDLPLRIVHARLNVGDDIFDRDFRFQHVRRADVQTAVRSGDIEVLEYLLTYFFRRAERHDGLRTDRPVEGQAVAVGIADFLEVHAFRLNGVENVHSGFDELGNQLRHMAAGMVENQHIGIDRAGGVNDALQTGWVSAIRRTDLRSS